MKRRSFLQFLGLGAAAIPAVKAATPAKMVEPEIEETVKLQTSTRALHPWEWDATISCCFSSQAVYPPTWIGKR